MDWTRIALDEHDRELGLGRDEPVTRAVRDGAREAHVDDESGATITVTIGASGEVASVTADVTRGDPRAWDEAAAAIARAMHGKTTRLPSGAHGLVLAFRVESHLRTSAGHLARAIEDAPVLVTPQDDHASRPPTFALGTPDPRCRVPGGGACTASINLDPTEALIEATTAKRAVLTVDRVGETTLP